MKKKLLIGLGTFFSLIIVTVIGVVIYFWPYISSFDWSIVSVSNIKALYVGLTEDPEITAARLKELDNKRSEEIKNYVNVEVRDFTEEEKQQIESGEKTETQIVAQIIAESVAAGKNTDVNTDEPVDSTGEGNATGEQTPEQQPDSDKPSTDTKPNTNAKGETADEIVARYIATLYEYHAEFEGRVAALAKNAHNWVSAYRKANGVTWKEAKVAGVQHFTGTATQIESDCYAKVDALIESLRAELKAIDADTSIVDVVKDSAYAEMDAKKAKIVQEGTAKLK